MESSITTHKTSSDHDSRYYTESEINTKLSTKLDTSKVVTSGYVGSSSITTTGGINTDYELKSITVPAGKYVIHSSVSTGNQDTVFCMKLFAGSGEICSAYNRGSSTAGITFHITRLYSFSSPTTIKLTATSFSTSGTITGWLLDYFAIQ